MKVINSLKEEIVNNFNFLMTQKRKGNNLFFTDVDSIKEQMINELKKM